MTRNYTPTEPINLKVIGVTGTNGKTTVATLLYRLFRDLGYNTALVSTVENKINDKTYKTNYTTPPNPALIAFFKKARRNNVEYIFMECSSHGIAQNRLAGLKFSGGIFTNLTRDHLDYHKTPAKYAKAKKRFFDDLPEEAFALANADDLKAGYMLRDTRARKYFYSLVSESDFSNPPKTKLIGKFNAYNALAVYATATILGAHKNKIKKAIRELDPPPGRLELVKSNTGITGVVDYAHTPDALENVLKTLRESFGKRKKIITVVGCGGERDKTKRPMMGKIACKLSDHVVFTSDNPRNEKPETILNDIIAGIPKSFKNYESIEDRAEAIKKAHSLAVAGDIILVAGKGHENYQIFKDKTVRFSDKKILEKLLG
jgi:UDP-N-acetylmuramoyl-L-alanyl-D-glutamate--2,6-diaminopimelate ligase